MIANVRDFPVSWIIAVAVVVGDFALAVGRWWPW